MQPRSFLARAVVYLLLLAGAAVYLFPFLWMLSTSLKPAEQTMHMPPEWLPMRYTVEMGQPPETVEVTRDHKLSAPAVVVQINEGPRKGDRLLVASDDYKDGIVQMDTMREGRRTKEPVSATFIKRAEPGWWYVVETFPTDIKPRVPRWDVVPEDAIAAAAAPRWNNYPMAIIHMGTAAERPQGFTPEQFKAELRTSPFWLYLGNTLIVCILGSLGSVLSNAVIAYGFSKLQWKGRDLLFALALATMMIPFPVTMVPLYGIYRDLGWIGTLKPLWLPAFFGNAFNIFLIRQFFMTIPKDLSEAARIDGCSEWAIFWRIILPLSRPVLAVVALFHFLGAWNDFMGPLIYLTRRETFTLSLGLQFFQSQSGGTQWHLLMAASTMVVLPIIILFFLTQKTFIKGIATTGLKG